MKKFYGEVEFTTIGETCRHLFFVEVMASTIEEARQKIAEVRLDTQEMEFGPDGWNPELISLIEGS